MSSGFLTLMRASAEAPLPDRAFLRCDRGDALYVSDAPRRAQDIDFAAEYAQVGFVCEVRGGLMYLTPDRSWIARLETPYPEPPGPLCASLLRFRGLDPDADALKLFASSVKCALGHADRTTVMRLHRQRAAVCLRDKNACGAGLYACALLEELPKEALI